MFRFLRLLSAGKSAAALQAVITVGAVAGGAAWAVSLDATKVVHVPVSVPASQSEPAAIPEVHGLPASFIPPPDTIFIVGSEELATAFRAALTEMAVSASQSGQIPSHTEIIQAASREEALRLGEWLTRESSFLSATGTARFNVVAVDGPAAP